MSNRQIKFEVEVIEDTRAQVEVLCNSVTCP